MPRPAPELEFRLRLARGHGPEFGPGKAELLGHIAATGSIRTAAAAMKMSYPRAWNLVQEMNAMFDAPLVKAVRGGGKGGGAALTPTGRRVTALYAAMEQAARRATRAPWRALRRRIR